MNAARFANWVEDQQLAAAGLGRRLADDPERTVIRLRRTSAGCGWLTGRWALLGNGLSTADGGRAGLHLDRRRPGAGPGPARPAGGAAPPGRPGGPAGVAPRRGPVGLGGGGGRAAGDRSRRRSPSWRSGMRRRGGHRAAAAGGLGAGVEIDLGPEGERLHRYEMAADRLFRSAWTKLERLRKEHGLPLIPRRESMAAPEPAPRPPAPPPPARGSPGTGTGGGAPADRGLEVVAAGRPGVPGARLLGRRPAPAGDQHRQAQ